MKICDCFRKRGPYFWTLSPRPSGTAPERSSTKNHWLMPFENAMDVSVKLHAVLKGNRQFAERQIVDLDPRNIRKLKCAGI